MDFYKDWVRAIFWLLKKLSTDYARNIKWIMNGVITIINALINWMKLKYSWFDGSAEVGIRYFLNLFSHWKESITFYCWNILMLAHSRFCHNKFNSENFIYWHIPRTILILNPLFSFSKTILIWKALKCVFLLTSKHFRRNWQSHHGFFKFSLEARRFSASIV